MTPCRSQWSVSTLGTLHGDVAMLQFPATPLYIYVRMRAHAGSLNPKGPAGVNASVAAGGPTNPRVFVYYYVT